MPNLINKINSCFIIFKQRGFITLLKAIYHLCFSKILKIFFSQKTYKRIVNNYKMFLDSDDRGISRGLILFGEREIDQKIIIEKSLHPGMCIYDIGANIGYYVIMENKIINKKGKIIAIEPSKKH